MAGLFEGQELVFDIEDADEETSKVLGKPYLITIWNKPGSLEGIPPKQRLKYIADKNDIRKIFRKCGDILERE